MVSQPEGATRLSFFLKIVLGIILTAIMAVVSFFGTMVLSVVYIDKTGNGFIQSDSGLYIILICFVFTMLVSYGYYSLQKIPRKFLITVYFVILILFGSFFLLQLTNVRTNQALVLNTYNGFRQAVINRDYETAHNLMSPNYRREHTVDDLAKDDFFLSYAMNKIDTIYAVEYTFWSKKAFIVYESWGVPTYWRRYSSGIALDFEYIDGQWFFTGQTALYMLH